MRCHALNAALCISLAGSSAGPLLAEPLPNQASPEQRIVSLDHRVAALDSRTAALDPRTAQIDTARAIALQATDLALASPSPLSTVLAAGQDQAIWLAVTLNGSKLDDLVEVLQPAGKPKAGLRITREQWQAMGLTAAANEYDANGQLALDDLIDIAYRYDVPTQRVYMKVPVERFQSNTVDLSSSSRAPIADPVGFSAALNYDVFTQYQRPDDGSAASTNTSGYLDGHIATPVGNFYQSAIAQNPSDGFERSVRRLDTSYRYFDQARLLSWQLGDAISRGLNTRPAVRFAGLQLQRNFSLRPDLLTVPTAQFNGSSTVPTTVDVLIDQVQRSRVAVPAGPFTLDQLPVLTGPHQVQVIVRDALGRDQVTVMDLYSSPQLLAPGLLDFSAQAGVLRQGYNSNDDSYDSSPFFIGSTRYGVNSRLTVEGQLELKDDVQMGSVGLTTVLGRRATMGLNSSLSQSDAGSALESTLSTELYLTSSWYLQGSVTLTDDAFRDISTIDLMGVRNRRREQASMSYSFDNGSNIGLSYVAQRNSDGSDFNTVFATAAQPFWQQGYASASLSHNLSDGNDTTFTVGLSWYLDNRVSLSARNEIAKIGNSRVLSAQSTVPQDSGWGWQLEAADGVRDYRRAALLNRNRYSDVNAMVEDNAFGQVGRLGVSGSVAWLPGAFMPTRRIADAFALVDLGYPNVPVFSENRPIGETDSNGRLMVPDLNAYIVNKLSISASELPFDVEIDDAARYVVPSRDAGIRVGFATRKEENTLVSLRLANGTPIALGSRLLMPDSDQHIIGYDGMILLTPALKGLTLYVLTETQRCTLKVPSDLLPDAQRATVLEVVCAE